MAFEGRTKKTEINITKPAKRCYTENDSTQIDNTRLSMKAQNKGVRTLADALFNMDQRLFPGSALYIYIYKYSVLAVLFSP